MRHKALKKFLNKIKFYIQAYQRLDILNRSASLSFYTIISVLPMILVIVFFANMIFPNQNWQTDLSFAIEKALPFQSEFLLQNLQALFDKQQSLGLISVFFLILSSQILYLNLEKTINLILHTNTKRNFFITRLIFFAWLSVMSLIIFSPIFVSLIMKLFSGFDLSLTPFTKISGHISFLTSSFLMFSLLLWILPTRKLSPKRVFKGSTFFAITLQIGKLVFKWFIFKNISRYNFIYGSLTSLFLIMLWIFYFYNMFLFFVYWTGRRNDPIYRQNRKIKNYHKLKM